MLFGRPHHPGELTVTVLGSAGTFGYPGNPCSGYLIRTDHTSVWLDCGPGTLAALQEHLPLTELDAVIVSHEHPDHCLELPVLRNAARYVLGIPSLPVITTAGTRSVVEGVLRGSTDPFVWKEVSDGGSALVGDLSFSFSVTDHPVETLAVRADWRDRSFGYSADTGPEWSFESLDPTGQGFDLVLCEATLGEDEAGSVQHLSGSQAGAMCRSAGARRLALTHTYRDTGSDRAEAAGGTQAFDGPVEIAMPGHVFTV